MTKNVLASSTGRLATARCSSDAPVPFCHFYGGNAEGRAVA